MVVHVANGNYLREHFGQLTRQFPRIRDRMNRIFSRSHIVFIYRISSSLRLFFHRTRPNQVIKVKMSRNYSITFKRVLFRCIPRFFTPMFMRIRQFMSVTRSYSLLLLSERPQVSGRGHILFQHALSTGRGQYMYPLRKTNCKGTTFQHGVSVSGYLSGAEYFHFCVKYTVSVQVSENSTVLGDFSLNVSASLNYFRSKGARFRVSGFYFDLLFGLYKCNGSLTSHHFPRVKGSMTVCGLSNYLVVCQDVLRSYCCLCRERG